MYGDTEKNDLTAENPPDSPRQEVRHPYKTAAKEDFSSASARLVAGSPESDWQSDHSGEVAGAGMNATTDSAEQTNFVFPRLSVEAQAPHTLSSRLFNLCSLFGFFILTALFLAQAAALLQDTRLLWYPEELQYADVLRGVFQGDWLILQLNGSPYSAHPPLFFWFLYGLSKLLATTGLDWGSDYARLMFAGTVISGLFFLWSVLALARYVARLDRRGVFASGCVLLSVVFLVGFFHYARMDLLFAAFIGFSLVFLFHGLVRKEAPVLMGLAFLFSGLAVLTEGPLGFVLPVFGAVLFSFWKGTPLRLLRKDFLFGLLLAVLLPAIWLGAIWAEGRVDFVMELLQGQVAGRVDNWASHKSFWYYLVFLPLLWLPWTFLFPLLPWHRTFGSTARTAFAASRNGSHQGVAFLWLFMVGGFVMLSAISAKTPIYLIPLLAPLAVVTGQAVLQLSPFRSMLFQRATALFFFALTLFFIVVPAYFTDNIPSALSWLQNFILPKWNVEIQGVFIIAAIFLAATCLLLGVANARRPESTLLILLLTMTAFAYPMSVKVAPSLDNVLSSQVIAEELRVYALKDYFPVSFKLPAGIFSCHVGVKVVDCSSWAELDRIFRETPDIALVMSAERWKNWSRTAERGIVEAGHFWLVEREVVLLLRTGSQNSEPASPALPEREAELGEQDGTEDIIEGPADDGATEPEAYNPAVVPLEVGAGVADDPDSVDLGKIAEPAREAADGVEIDALYGRLGSRAEPYRAELPNNAAS